MVWLRLEPNGGRMVDTDKSTEQWRHPYIFTVYDYIFSETN